MPQRTCNSVAFCLSEGVTGFRLGGYRSRSDRVTTRIVDLFSWVLCRSDQISILLRFEVLWSRVSRRGRGESMKREALTVLQRPCFWTACNGCRRQQGYRCGNCECHGRPPSASSGKGHGCGCGCGRTVQSERVGQCEYSLEPWSNAELSDASVVREDIVGKDG